MNNIVCLATKQYSAGKLTVLINKPSVQTSLQIKHTSFSFLKPSSQNLINHDKCVLCSSKSPFSKQKLYFNNHCFEGKKNLKLKPTSSPLESRSGSMWLKTNTENALHYLQVGTYLCQCTSQQCTWQPMLAWADNFYIKHWMKLVLGLQRKSDCR